MIELGESVDDLAETLGVIRVVGAVNCRDREASGSQGQFIEKRDRFVSESIAHLHQNIGHDVADNDCAVGQAFVGEVRECDLRRCEEQIGSMIRENAIVLLRHPAIERAQSGLKMRDGEVEFDGAQGRGNRRIGVAIDEHPVRLVLFEDRIQGRKHRPGLNTVAAGADPEMNVSSGNTEILEKDIRKHGVIMLARVHNDVLDVRLGCRFRDRGEFNELGARTDDACDLHKPILCIEDARRRADSVIA